MMTVRRIPFLLLLFGLLSPQEAHPAAANYPHHTVVHNRQRETERIFRGYDTVSKSNQSIIYNHVKAAQQNRTRD